MPPTVRYHFIFIKRIAAARKRSQRALMEHVHLRISMIQTTNRKGLSIFMLGDTWDAPSTGSNLPKNQRLESQQYSMNTVEVVLKLKAV